MNLAVAFLSIFSWFQETESEPVKPATLISEAAFMEVAIPLIAKWEGVRLTAYQDIVGVWTVCFGETKGVRPGDRYTLVQCEKMLEEEVKSYRNDLHTYFSRETKETRLTPHRDAAYVSLAYNAGVRGIGKSTATRRLNNGNIVGGCKALTWWNKAGGRVIRGLVNRRSEERDLCLKGV